MDQKAEIIDLLERENHIEVLAAVKTILKKSSITILKEKLTERAIKSELDIKKRKDIFIR